MIYLEMFAIGIIFIAFLLYFQVLRIAIKRKPSETTVVKAKKRRRKGKKPEKVEKVSKREEKRESEPSFWDDLKEVVKRMVGMGE